MVYRSHYKRPQIPPKVDFGGPNYVSRPNLFIWEKKYIYKNEVQNEYIHK